jgi:predicted nucleotidyltransferase
MEPETALEHLAPNERACGQRFLAMLAERLGVNLLEVWLYGSAARGDMWSSRMPMHSDVDLLVLTEEAVAAADRDALVNETYPLFLECGRQISPQFRAAEAFLTSGDARVHAVRSRVLREGRVLHRSTRSPVLDRG